jgi:hypothetical protein
MIQVENLSESVNLDAPANITGWDWSSTIPADGSIKYFLSDQPIEHEVLAISWRQQLTHENQE